MRGKVPVAVELNFSVGITPAYAGKSIYDGKQCKLGRGSPPPMRGKVLYSTLLYFFERITPAYAGKSKTSNSLLARMRDHPRLCGEKTAFHSLYPLPLGSPPPMRGKGVYRHFLLSVRRITPAYAGKSQISEIFWTMSQDHPRLCGEKSATPQLSTTVVGSPPPMRGKVDKIHMGENEIGITPAYAGKR